MSLITITQLHCDEKNCTVNTALKGVTLDTARAFARDELGWSFDKPTQRDLCSEHTKEKND